MSGMTGIARRKRTGDERLAADRHRASATGAPCPAVPQPAGVRPGQHRRRGRPRGTGHRMRVPA